MKKFSDFNIQHNSAGMTGEKIKISKVINRQIIVHQFKIEDSKYPKNKSGKCLHLQIEMDSVKWVIFTGSDVLINQIKQVPEDHFPFETIIVKNNEHFEFT